MSKTKKKIFKKKKLTQQQLQASILRLLKKDPKAKYNAKELIRKLKLKNNKDSVLDALAQLQNQGGVRSFNGKYKIGSKKIKSTKQGNGKLRSISKEVLGKVDLIRSGAAYIVVGSDQDDVYVPQKFLNSAMHGDEVRVSILRSRKGRKPEGEVIEVIKRANKKFVGNLEISKKGGLVMVDHPKMTFDVKIDPDNINGAQDGDRVIVEVTKFARGNKKSYRGQITNILDSSDRNEMEMNTILINNGFELAFSPEVIKVVNELTDDITEKDLLERRDMREDLTFTIDPHDAKDFDDAISYKVLEDDIIEIGVHIADVTHYVKSGTALDEEAYARSTSVYLVDRVCPMLPERLSNELCSLRPNEDKFTFSAVFKFDSNYKIKDRWFGKTLTHSNRRFTYEEAQEILESGQGDLANELKAVAKVAAKMRKERFKNGAINFESDEVKFKLDENKKPIGVYVKQRKEANLLVEDFMLLANKEVAKYIAKKVKAPEVPFVYRVHDEPDQDRLADFALFAKEMGVKVKVDTPANIAKSLNKLAEKAKTDESVKLLQPLAIRTMAKAVYTSENIGHYGLGFDYYTHFTSPIRRYSDVLVHRILYKNLKKVKRVDKEKLEAKCKHISAQERKAIESERESTKYKQVEYLEGKEGEVFEGYVSGMIDKGIFVQLSESKAEGLIKFDAFDEPYVIEDSRMKATGARSGDKIKMGDKVKVKLIETDLDKREIELEIVS